MVRKPARRRIPTKFDKAKQREDTRLLVFLGYPVREAARLTGVTEANALKWSAQDGWLAELERIRSLAQIKQPMKLMEDNSAKVSGDVATNTAFDLAATNRQSRAALSQIVNLTTMHTLKTVTTKPQTISVETTQDLKSLTETAAKIDGSWDDTSANRFAISLNLNQLVQSGAIKDVPPGDWEIVEED